ncbi:GFA family protein [Reinekea marina]|uniref:GFA family protein n=1 Tax=Reinekea marina TaxID=1310421 RepID=A0ABV7WRI9_9GAMM
MSFELNGEFESFYLCHCKHCQKDTGSAHASNLFSTTAKLIWRTGKSKITTYKLPKTKHVKSFCSSCGSAVPNIQMNNKLVVVPAGCLNEEISIKPTAHIFKASAASWEDNLDNVKSYDQLPE